MSDAAESPSPPRRIVRRGARSRRPLWREVWEARGILWLLTRRDLKARYAGSMLGVLWNVIHPIVMILIYIVILGSILSRKFGGVSQNEYVVHLVAGIIPWLAFQEVLTRCSTALLDNASIIKKVAFPEIVLHLSVLLNTLFVHCISYAAFIALVTLFGAWPGPQVFLCYGILVTIALFGLGLGLLVSVVNIYFRDVVQVVNIGLQFLFWFTPIVYFPTLLAGQESFMARFALRALELNPVMHFTRLSQWLFGVSTASYSTVSLAVTLLAPLAALIAGLLMFQRFKHDVLDNI